MAKFLHLQAAVLLIPKCLPLLHAYETLDHHISSSRRNRHTWSGKLGNLLQMIYLLMEHQCVV
nr:hypothetical protein Iba_chr11cCG10560 [Ipomoea batatas]